MKCPICGYTKSIVIDSRPTEEGASIRRRRECLACKGRFTTYEVIESLPLVVIKKDNTREAFDKNKLLAGIVKSCYKCPVTMEQMENITAEIEAELNNALRDTVTSVEIGNMVMEKLRKIDEVSYVRFASVYREFKDIETFMEELRALLRPTDNL